MTTSSVHPPEKTGQAWTILKLLSWTTSYFVSHHIEQPRATAEVLLAYTLGVSRIDLYLRYDQPLHQAELSRFKDLIKRRKNAEPVAYITGEKEFWSMAFTVTSAVLIPRPDTECLVEATLNVLPTGEPAASPLVLELGTGSGAIAVALASERSSARIYALDRSFEAILIARLNARRLGVSDRISFFCSDWFSAVRPGALFDIVVSNPPYIRQGDLGRLQPEIVRYEPAWALSGGPLGLDCLNAIIARAWAYLTPGGYLLLEIGYDQKASVMEIARQADRYEPTAFLRDYGGHDRVVVLRSRR